MLNIIKHPIEFYINKIRAKDYFKFARYGDGEWMYYFKSKKEGEPLVKKEVDFNDDFSNHIIKTVYEHKESESYFYGMQNLSVRIFGDRLPRLNWVFGDVFHFASIYNKLMPFLKVLKENKLVFVGGNYLRAIEEYLPIEHFIEIPDKNCFEKKIEILWAIRDYGKPAIYIFQCSALSCVLIYELDIPESFLIDSGSLLDPLVGRLNRKYHHGIAENGVLEGYQKELKK